MAKDPLIGQVLHDTHEIVRSIGHGGMSTVYEAVHVRLRKKRFAVKVLHARMKEEQAMLARFQREAEIASEIGHPNIVNVTDFYETDDGQPCIVMEHLQGEDLAQQLNGQNRPPRRLNMGEVIQLLDQVGSALQAVHDKDVVHRDLKPANIFLCDTQDGSIKVKILDFGVSKIRDSGDQITGDMAVLGTPSYMSPEQGEGHTHEVDSRTDIFALGVISYRLLSNQLPFTGSTMVSVIRAICDKPHKPITAHVPDLGPEVDRVLNRALAKDKAERYPRMDQFVAELRAALQARLDDAPKDASTSPEVLAGPVGWTGALDEDDATTPMPLDTGDMIIPVSTSSETISKPEAPAPPAFGPEARTERMVLRPPMAGDTPGAEPRGVDAVATDPATPAAVTPEPEVPTAVTPEPEVPAAVTPEPAHQTGDTTLSGMTGEVPVPEAAEGPAGSNRRLLTIAGTCLLVLALAGLVVALQGEAEPEAQRAAAAPAREPAAESAETSGGGPDTPPDEQPAAETPETSGASAESPTPTPDAGQPTPDLAVPDASPDRAPSAAAVKPGPGPAPPARARPPVKRLAPRKRRPATRQPRPRPAPSRPKKRPAFEDL